MSHHHIVEIQDILKILKDNDREDDIEIVQYAYDFAKKAHEGQTRASGEPYIIHPLATAYRLAEMKLDTSTIVAGLLHDVPEDTSITIKDIKKEFGNDVAELVEGITKLGRLKYRGMERYAENLRKMFLAMAKDIRTIFIKFADRLHNLSTLEHLEAEKQQRIAQECLEIYAPIADRLGMGMLKGEIEDTAFRYANPVGYEEIKKLRESKIKENSNILDKTVNTLKKELSKEKIQLIQVDKRIKRLYSLYKKIQKKESIDSIYDICAIRIIVPDIESCYRVLGIIHSKYKPLPGRIKDYIALPKLNGYQSIHTTVFAEKNQITEIQVRTMEMHEQAEKGIASHWHYKETGVSKIISQKLNWMHELMEIQKDVTDNNKYLNTIKLDVFKNRIFVFTPKGDVIDLPEAATPIDFAFQLHTDLGMRCASVKVNGQIRPLDYELNSGDVIEIITDKNRKKPNRDWLEFVKTHKAKEKIRQAHGLVSQK